MRAARTLPQVVARPLPVRRHPGVSVPALALSRWEGLRRLRRRPIELFEEAARLGDVVRIPLPGRTVLLLNDPDLAWGLLATHARAVRKSPVLRGARRVLGDGLLTSEGDLHRRQRRLVQPQFHHERLRAAAATMVARADRAAGRWRDGQELDLHAEMTRLTLGIVASTVFDADVDREADEVGRAMRDVLATFDRLFSPLLPVWERLPLPSTIRYRRGLATFDRVVGRLIAERRRGGHDGVDLLSALIRATEDGRGMGDRQVRDEAVTLFLAGHETTSNALTWTWHLLAGAPSAEEALHRELDGVLGKRTPGPEDLDVLPYTAAVLEESLRLRPPAWAIGREVVEPIDLGAVRLEPRDVAVVSPWLLHRDPRWWGEDAAAFRPGRWVRGGEDRPRHAFLPFGAGPRMCLGEGFARLETRLVLATIARRWRFEPLPGRPVDLQPVITLRPRSGLPVRARRRRAVPTP